MLISFSASTFWRAGALGMLRYGAIAFASIMPFTEDLRSGSFSGDELWPLITSWKFEVDALSLLTLS